MSEHALRLADEPTPVMSTAADWLVGSAVIVIVPLLRELPLWVGATYLAAIGLRFLHTHWHWAQPSRVVRGVCAVLAIALVYRYFGTLLGRGPGVALLVLLTGLKLLELRSARDAALAAMLLLLVVLGGFLYNNSLLLGVYTVFAVTAVTAALVRLQDPALPPRAVARVAAVLIVQAIPLMLVAYILFPRLPEGGWGLRSAGGHALTGMPDNMRPGSISALSFSDAVAFRAHLDGRPPPNRALYWRVRIFWNSDGRVWTEGPRMAVHDLLHISGKPVKYRLVVEPSDKRWLPTLDMPVAGPHDLRKRAGFIYETRNVEQQRRAYDFTSYTHYRTGALGAAERRRALALPAILSDRVRALAQRWRAKATRDRDVVRAALTYFNQKPFVYTLTPPLLGRDPVDEFLFDTRRGFCEHYAAAFVTLMRAAGVPARVVVGYQGGVYNPTGNYVIVRQEDAHAWAEVWLPASGWTRVDPTAAVAPARIEYGIDAVRRLTAEGLPLNTAADVIRRAIRLPWLDRLGFRAHLAWDYLNFSWYLWVGDYSFDRQAKLLAQFGLADWSVPVMIAILVQLVFLYALLQLRRHRPVDPVQRQYERYCRKLARAGMARGPAEGPLALARRARARWPDLVPAIDRITELYVALRYGRARAGASARALGYAIRRFHPRAGDRGAMVRSRN